MLAQQDSRSDAAAAVQSSLTGPADGRPIAGAPPPALIPPPLVEIDGRVVNISNMAQAAAIVIARLEYAQSFLLCTLNLDHLVKLRSNVTLREAYARAELVTADGFPIVTLARLRGCQLERTTGSDLIEPLCAAATSRHVPIFLMGSSFSVLSASARRLIACCPNLEIVGVYAPPSDFNVWSESADEAIDLIRSSACRLCFLALGAPLQEVFALRAIDETSGVGFMPIGAGLDFLAGRQRRAPRALQRMNLEWAWRLARDPRRLWQRYACCGVLFAGLLIKELADRGRRRLLGGTRV
jgi:N-acetylglucosaminyldiphosphoundecaprenol N-acetyl-beta-D-mannosaminyltransferase